MKAIVLLSGGIDSVTLLHHVVANGKDEVIPLFCDYGQVQRRLEKKCAEGICTKLGLKLLTIELGALAQTRGEYIPNRNSVLIMNAVHVAEKIGAGKIYYGAILGGTYVDCTLEYVVRMNDVLALSNIKLVAPFIEKDKGAVIGMMLGMNIDIDDTFSCNYTKRNWFFRRKECGKCNDCLLRAEVKRLIQVYDSTH